MKIIFFIEALCSGGKERRLVELLSYLKEKPQYELLVVLTRNEIHYTKFLDLDISYAVIERKGIKKDPRPFYYFYRICKKFKPDIIHVWGNLNAIYSLPAVIFQKISLINSQITDAPPKLSKLSPLYWTSYISFKFSSVILANSFAGLDSYDVPQKKSRVIYNGINLKRFQLCVDRSAVKAEFGIKTPFSVIMVASFSDKKDYDRFVDIANYIHLKRNDISFIAVGDGVNLQRIQKRVDDDHMINVIFTGRIKDVESLVSIADIGMLFSPKGEGISNSILEYMAMGKPVIANDAGGTREIVQNNINGYLIKNETPGQIADMIIKLIENKKIRLELGLAGKTLIEKKFILEKMGKEFERVFIKIHNRGKNDKRI